ncbi:MAG: transcription termination factor NusA [Desulfobacterales bacterium]
MFISDIKRVVEQVSRDKGINREILIKALEEALVSAAKKKFGSSVDIEVQYNESTGEIEVFQFKDVAEVVTEPDLQISIKEGRKLDPECEVGDSLGTKMDTSTFGRIAAQSAKQVIIQKMKDAERDAVYSNFIDRKGEIINGIVQRFDRNDIIVNLGHTEGILPTREQIPKESYRRGDRIRAYIVDVLYDTRGPQIVISRTHPDFLVALFKTEVPEINEGIVTIIGATREPGIRAKFAVTSNDSDIDPVGACVGMKGSRVQNVVQELRGEKIDIIPYHIDPARFVCNALAPAEISRVIIDEENRSMEVIVPDEFLSIAIGKKGQNVRLASKLTKWHLDVISETRYSEAMQDGYDSLVSLPDVGISLADALYEKGFFSADELSRASIEDLIQIRDITEEKAIQLIEAGEAYLLSRNQADETSKETLPEDDDEQNGSSDVSDSLKVSEEQSDSDEDQADEASKETLSEEEENEHNGSSDVSDSIKAPDDQPDSDEDQADEASKETLSEEENEHNGSSDVSDSLKVSEEQSDDDEDQADEASKETLSEEEENEHNGSSDISDSIKASDDQPGSDEDVTGQTMVSDEKEADSAESTK